jgi:anthranilate synthase component I
VTLPEDGPDVPRSLFLLPEVVIRFDHALGVAEILHGGEAAAGAVSPHIAPASGTARAGGRNGRTRRLPDAASYQRLVARAQEHIRDGDAFQIVLSQRAERQTAASAVALYRALRRINPSPYLFLLELGDFAMIGSSPETLVKADGRSASLNPIAGTTNRGPGDAERLLASEKDRAEHVMLVDLGRNDLSRVCVPGTVRVERFLDVEPYSHVTHLVSEVDGKLTEGVGHVDLLRACFPAGTVSGAPKIRAMQIISELEGYRRGTYAGAVGYLLPGHSLDTCITIRTIVLREGVAFMQAGAGIVADSDPRAEHEECLDKLAAVEAAIDLAEQGDA